MNNLKVWGDVGVVPRHRVSITTHLPRVLYCPRGWNTDAHTQTEFSSHPQEENAQFIQLNLGLIYPFCPVKKNSSHPEGAGETGACESFFEGRWSRVQGSVRQVRRTLAPGLFQAGWEITILKWYGALRLLYQATAEQAQNLAGSFAG